MPDRIGVKEISAERAEGSHADLEPHRRTFKVSTWGDANARLLTWAKTAPRKGYHKCDFTILFADNATYQGRFDLVNWKLGFPWLDRHVLDHCGFMAGTKKPPHMSPSEWTRAQAMVRQSEREMYMKLLREYDIPGAEMYLNVL